MSSNAEKSAQAFRTISEVAKELGLATHVLRFWESKFPQVKPLKRAGGRRYYRPDDVVILKRLQVLLHDEGYTIKGVQKLLREEGTRKFVEHAAQDQTDSQATTDAPDEVSEQAPVDDMPTASSKTNTTDTPVQTEAPTPQGNLFDAPAAPAAPAPVAAPVQPVQDPAPAIKYSPDLLPEAPEPLPVPDADSLIPPPGLSPEQRDTLQGVLKEMKSLKEKIDQVA